MDVLNLSSDLAMDPHESFCFGQRRQRLLQLIIGLKIKCFVVHFESLVKLFGLMLLWHRDLIKATEKTRLDTPD